MVLAPYSTSWQTGGSGAPERTGSGGSSRVELTPGLSSKINAPCRGCPIMSEASGEKRGEEPRPARRRDRIAETVERGPPVQRGNYGAQSKQVKLVAEIRGLVSRSSELAQQGTGDQRGGGQATAFLAPQSASRSARRNIRTECPHRLASGPARHGTQNDQADSCLRRRVLNPAKLPLGRRQLRT